MCWLYEWTNGNACLQSCEEFYIGSWTAKNNWDFYLRRHNFIWHQCGGTLWFYWMYVNILKLIHKILVVIKQ